MSTGSNNTTGERIVIFSRAGYLARSAFTEGLVATAWQGSGYDNMDACLPNNANAGDGGRDFLGIWMSSGTATSGTDKGSLQKLGVAQCVLKANTACYAGTVAAYDPTDGGTMIPWTNVKQVPTGRFTQTKGSSTGTQFVGVELFGAGGQGRNTNLLGKIAGPSTTVTNTAVETAYGLSLTIPAGLLTSANIVKLRGEVLCLNTGANSAVVKVYWGSTAIATSASLTPNANDIYEFDLVVDIRSATAAWVHGYQSTFAAPGTAAYKGVGPAAAITIDTTLAVSLTVAVLYGGASANDQTALETFSAEIQ